MTLATPAGGSMRLVNLEGDIAADRGRDTQVRFGRASCCLRSLPVPVS